MAENVVSFLVERIGDLLILEGKPLYAVPDEVKLLQKELQLMRCFLRDADSRQGDARVRCWVAEITDLAYDADDIIDTFALEIQPTSKCGNKDLFTRFSSCSKAKLLHDVGSVIGKIKTGISQLTRSLETYGIEKLKEGESQLSSYWAVKRKLRHTYSHVFDHNAVGLEEDARILVEKLVNEGQHNRVVSICGMGGLGKTTLARKVYYQDEVRRHFQHFIWVCVSQQWETRDLWEQMLFKVISPDQKMREEISKKKDDEVAKELYKVLKDTRCLVVLDDIWQVNAFSLLSAGFPTHGEENTKTKILLTSRNKEVAFRADPRGFLYEPSCMENDHSWELFRKIAIFERVQDDTDYPRHHKRADRSNKAFITLESMERLGREMVAHCRGLPVAIVMLGGILATKYTNDEWHMVHENIKSQLKTGKGDEDQQFGVFEVLALSYDDLPYQLKSCFLHLGQFPEDFEMPTKRIINLWIGESIISSEASSDGENEETLEDVAYRYLTELTERYLVQVEKRSSSGRIKSFRMHDLIRELCLLKAKENNFFQIINLRNSNETGDLFSSSMINKPPGMDRMRRVSISFDNFRGDIPLESKNCPPIRSVLGFLHHRHSEIGQKLFDSMISSFKLLRVLDLENLQGFSIPKRIGMLIHLRVLTLDSSSRRLLSSFGNLTFLLSLNLGQEKNKPTGLVPAIFWTVPDVIWKMKKSRHLYLPVAYHGKSTATLPLANLKDLQTLKNFPTTKADVKDLTTLINLRKLVIQIHDKSSLDRFMGIFQSPLKFDHLRHLSIVQLDVYNLKGNYGPGPDRIDVVKIRSCCPRLQKLKLNGHYGRSELKRRRKKNCVASTKPSDEY